MAKPKIDVKDLLLKKGQYIAFGVAGVGLVVLLLLGATTWAGAENPAEITTKLKSDTEQVYTAIATRKMDIPPLHASVDPNKKSIYPIVDVKEFRQEGPFFDPIAKPDTKRENPQVLGIEEYQLDLVRAPMKGYDITYSEGNAQIAVRVVKKLSDQDKDGVKKALKDLRPKGKTGAQKNQQYQAAQPVVPMNKGPMGFGPMGAMGPGGTGFDASAQRTETAITYVPLDDLDKAIAENKLPAMTVIPLRLAIVNATFPLKKQMEEVKRAMRLETAAQAAPYVQFDGFEVRRRITRAEPGGEPVEVQGWAEYKYEDKYVELIDARKLNDHFEGAEKDNPRAAYLPYFYRYEDALVMPLPELVAELGGYPDITKKVRNKQTNQDEYLLKSINKTIDELEKLNTVKQSPSDLADRLQRQRGAATGKKGLFMPVTTGNTGADKLFGEKNFAGPYVDPTKMSAAPKGPMGGINPMGVGANAAPAIDIDHLLVRFVDCDIKPGLTYEYQIRVRMFNPNFGYPQYMAIPQQAVEEKYKVLAGAWVPLGGSLTVPSEAFVFAGDPAAYKKQIDDVYKPNTRLHKLLDLKDGQAVVQEVAWLEQVRTDAGNNREPVGAWVVAEMPVGRGEYVGKKTYVKLPLWSSENNQYVLRDLAANALPKGKETAQPKGWLVDFSRDRSILVDYDGGKVTTRASGGRTIVEDVNAELLLVRPDGTLQVRNSAADTADENRKEMTRVWGEWVKKVEERPAGGASGPMNPFDRPK